MASIHFGHRRYQFPSSGLGELTDSSNLLGDAASLRERFDRDGYLLLRRVLDPDDVKAARAAVINYLLDQDDIDTRYAADQAVARPSAKGVYFGPKPQVSRHPDALRVFEGDALNQFYEAFYNQPIATFDWKWLRAVGPEESTGIHYDVVYMGRGTSRLMTCWLPMGRITPQLGSLAICEGSHRSEGFARLRETYGRFDVDRDSIKGDQNIGWFSHDPQEITERFGGQWKTTIFEPGDILTFGMWTLHASTTNTTGQFRISADVRFQPASEPMDPRWAGRKPRGNEQGLARQALSLQQAHAMSMDEARAKWGV